jgi:hypothetical protein
VGFYWVPFGLGHLSSVRISFTKMPPRLASLNCLRRRRGFLSTNPGRAGQDRRHESVFEGAARLGDHRITRFFGVKYSLGREDSPPPKETLVSCDISLREPV